MSERYWMITPVHPEKVVGFFLALHHYWFDESLGPNAFTGMHDDARKYLDVWTETGEFAPDKSTLEIYVRMKFEEWLKSSWSSTAPAASQKRIEALEAALVYIKQFCGGRLKMGTSASRLAAQNMPRQSRCCSKRRLMRSPLFKGTPDTGSIPHCEAA